MGEAFVLFSLNCGVMMEFSALVLVLSVPTEYIWVFRGYLSFGLNLGGRTLLQQLPSIFAQQKEEKNERMKLKIAIANHMIH